MEEQDADFASYKDISELRKELEGIKGKADVSNKEIYDAMQKLAGTIMEMLDIFSAASSQLRLEEKEYEAESKKHDMIISKLEKISDQNKTIAEGMVALVEMIKGKLVQKEESAEAPGEEVEAFKQEQSPKMPTTFNQVQQDWQPRPEPMPRMQKPAQAFAPPAPTISPMPPIPPMPQLSMPSFASQPQMPDQDFGMELPPLGEPAPDFNFPEELKADEEPKKKGLFGMFKK
ncbi:hypothetical protein HYS31_04895 [Candidatus Woesearchaeota archaeon]|nr:hypothetical protein [Candidatus Woesearchaeota archaeon]